MTGPATRRAPGALLVIVCAAQACGLAGGPEASVVRGPHEAPIEAREASDPPRRGVTGPIGTDPGRVTLHRLNGIEYDNTVRDLFGTALRPSVGFPPDDSGYGFDNVADVLSLSPLHVELYQTTAEALVEEALTGAARARFVTCDPGAAGDAACLREVVARFGRRAWRRPLTTEEIDWLAGFLDVAAAHGGGFEDGLRMALQAVLVSQNFVFRVEVDPDPTSLAPHPLDDHELAARLSYFLWSSTPDDALLDAADAGTLHDPAVLRAHVTRMLADPRSRAIVDNFGGQWLGTRALDTHSVDSQVYPLFGPALQNEFRQETRSYFEGFLHGDLGMDRFLTADFTVVTDRLALFYGLPLTGDPAPHRVSLAGTPRVGVVTQGAVLTVTSHANRTSPVKRGLWVLSQLLCAPPPPPPPNTASLPSEAVPTGTLRQRVEQHRANPSCASCHQAMDPIGFGFENFDGIGFYRTMDSGFPVDAAGRLPTGESFDTPAQLAAIVAGDPRYARCVTQHLLTYALGRGLGDDDEPAVDGIQRAWRAQGMRLRDLVAHIALSVPFRQRRGDPTVPGGDP